MKKKIFLFLSIVFLSLAPGRPEETSAKIKAIYIYNFTKYIEWPESYKQGNFVIGIIGNNNELVNELNKMATVKTVGNQHLEIKNISPTSDIGCHIIYILSDNSTQLTEVIENNKNKSTLIITDKAGLAAKGAGINFVVQENKQKIELNKSNIERYKLKVASSLVELAIQVK
ncbi:MAG TPA: YfiR family protein [Bacteroidia bacterium]|jgi:hypothetical protein|nr:YfiR family protein [Bacteroidia bacterium]